MTTYRMTEIVVAVIAVTLVSVSSTTFAATRQVCSSGCAYTTIQGAVDAAASGEAIMVFESVRSDVTTWQLGRTVASDSRWQRPSAGLALIFLPVRLTNFSK